MRMTIAIPRPVGRIDLNAAVVDPENFDRWLFGDEQSDGERKRHLENLLRARIEVVVWLTESQRSKLRLAGRGDIKRFFDEVEDRRSRFEIDRRRFKTGRAALMQLDRLSQTYEKGPFGDGSLFAKTLQRIQGRRLTPQ